MKKISSYRFLLLFALAFLIAVNSYNQETQTADSITQLVPADDESVDGDDSYYPDTLKRDYRSIDYDSVRAINNDKGFYYKKYMDSLLRAIEARLKNMEERRNRDSIRNNKAGQSGKGQLRRDTNDDDGIFSGSGLGIIFWILAIALFGYIVFKLFLSNASFFFGKQEKYFSQYQDRSRRKHE